MRTNYCILIEYLYDKTLHFGCKILQLLHSCRNFSSDAIDAENHQGTPKTAVHFGLLDFFQQLETSSQVSSSAMASLLNWMNAKDVSCRD
jgi:hypothetical protein